MEWFQLSYYSLGVFTCFLICLITFLFLATKRGLSTSTKWLLGVFASFGSLFFGYFSAYSVFAEWGANHRILTGIVLFGNASFIAFAYHFPKNDYPKEAKYAIPTSFILAIFAYIHYLYEVLTFEKFYNFEAHHYNTEAGKLFALVVLLYFVYGLVVLYRKIILHSEYNGKYKNKFIVNLIKLYTSNSKAAHGARSYLKAFLFLLIISSTNGLLKAGIISYDVYAVYFAVFSLLTSFYLVVNYINNAEEPTTFMVKLIGISLVSILLVIGFVSRVTLEVNESDYDNQKIVEVFSTKDHIEENRLERISDKVEYILVKEENAELFQKNYTLLHSKKDSKEPISLDKLYIDEEKEKEHLFKKYSSIVKKKYPGKSAEELNPFILQEVKSHLPKDMQRGYRKAGFLYTYYTFQYQNKIYEVGFSYREYREHSHKITRKVFFIIIGITLLTLFLFPKFFQSSLVKPLDNLLKGVKRVNRGILEFEVVVNAHDEIGFLASSFNSMVKNIREAKRELQDYAENLELKVKERTREVQERMEEVHKLKVQQDGDYFLTSLLAKPLFYNANKSKVVSTKFLIKQKKQFEFKNRKADLGGDICITGNLRLGERNNYKRYTMAMNGDAMGKSMQGAGGSLVMGVVMNSIMARSASDDKILNVTPEQWLSNTYYEIHSVFKSFNGTMVISATILLIENETGKVCYFNAEHPFSVLYRDGLASFIEDGLKLRKIGLDSEFEFQVFSFQLLPGDVIILGSDGRDDIDLTPDAPFRTINDNENLFLRAVEEGKGEVTEIEKAIKVKGELTDDLSLLRIGFKEDLQTEEDSIKPDSQKEELKSPSEQEQEEIKQEIQKPEAFIAQDEFEIDEIYERAKTMYYNGDITNSVQTMLYRFEKDQSHKKMNRLLGLLLYKNKDYTNCVKVINRVLIDEPNHPDLLYYLAISLKKIGEYSTALNVANTLQNLQPNHINNLLNISDLYRVLGNIKLAKEYVSKALEIDANNSNALKLSKLLSEKEGKAVH